ncbi:jg25341 [Pararge aegeria aegeria]|uniref:Ribosomal protein n=1 Tax=Pararge aegeria aegeria TaxID=348720 RepID=A0A8S4S229_9NEOP|nr:jg25341 [Pararge aegeria aegeria]
MEGRERLHFHQKLANIEFRFLLNMQRIISATKTFLGIPKNVDIFTANFSMFQNGSKNKLLPVCLPTMDFISGFKVKGRVKRRCKSCYFVNRQERLYVICPERPRHKQMAKKPKPLNTWILTHASQSKVRPW